MMYIPTEEEERMMEERNKYLVFTSDGPRLRDDAPDYIKEYHKKLKEIYTLGHMFKKKK